MFFQHQLQLRTFSALAARPALGNHIRHGSNNLFQRQKTMRSPIPLIVRPSFKSRFKSTSLSENSVIVYEGPFWRMLSLLKKVSVFSCACTMIGIPILSAIGNEKLNAVQRGSVGFTVVSFALLTTGTLHYVVKPYICRMILDRATNSFNIVTLNFYGGLKTSRLGSLSEISTSGTDRVFSTFHDSAGTYFYVHEERSFWKDVDVHKQLMAIIEAGNETNEESSTK